MCWICWITQMSTGPWFWGSKVKPRLLTATLDFLGKSKPDQQSQTNSRQCQADEYSSKALKRQDNILNQNQVLCASNKCYRYQSTISSANMFLTLKTPCKLTKFQFVCLAYHHRATIIFSIAPRTGKKPIYSAVIFAVHGWAIHIDRTDRTTLITVFSWHHSSRARPNSTYGDAQDWVRLQVIYFRQGNW